MKLLQKLLGKSELITDAALFLAEQIKSHLRRKQRYELTLQTLRHGLQLEFSCEFTDQQLIDVLKTASENVYSSGIRILCDKTGLVASRPLSAEVMA